MSTQLNENARKWVEALRSGQYEKGRGRLRTLDDKFCCLGVACDVIDPDGWEQLSDLGWRHNGCTGNLPSAVQERLGLTDPSGVFDGGNLIGRNDWLTTFAEIADLIELQPRGLFR